MRKLIVLLSVFTLLAAACGGGDEGELTTTQGTARPEATSEAEPEPTAEPDEDGDAADDGGDAVEPGTQTDEGGDQPESTQAPAEPQGSSGVNPPSDGTYVYDLEGSSTDPFNPAGPPREFADDAEATVDVTHSGDVYTSETTNSESPGVSTTKTKWESSRVLLLSLKTETGGGDFGCVFDPPIVATKLPPAPEAYATQEWQCKDSEGSGSTDITIVGQEDVTDANGKTWSTWKVETHTVFDFGQASGVQDDTRWVAPELGMDVRSEGSSEGEFELGAGQTQPFTSESRTVLKRHPGS